MLETVKSGPPVLPAVEIDLELIRRFDQHGPRYTSYPTADRFVEAFGADHGHAQGAIAGAQYLHGIRPLPAPGSRAAPLLAGDLSVLGIALAAADAATGIAGGIGLELVGTRHT